MVDPSGTLAMNANSLAVTSVAPVESIVDGATVVDDDAPAGVDSPIITESIRHALNKMLGRKRMRASLDSFEGLGVALTLSTRPEPCLTANGQVTRG
jgi:hypothetical protein